MGDFAPRWPPVPPGADRYDHRMAADHAAHATVAEEEYLERLFWLYEAGLPMTGANMARAMQLSAPTVHGVFRGARPQPNTLRTLVPAVDTK